jgi:adenylate kinase family enzyme
MPDFPPLESLGQRIMVLGPTNAGKSSLTEAIALRTGIPPVHLDQLRHLPHTNWVERDDAEFKALHDAAVARDEWVMDGGYSKLMAPRLTRVTGIIVLDERLSVRVRRYLWRSIFQRRRPGGLEGQQDSVTWKMLHWLWASRNNGEKYGQLARQHGGPKLIIQGQSELDALYTAWGLRRP